MTFKKFGRARVFGSTARAAFAVLALSAGCAKPRSSSDDGGSPGRYLYVASGLCQAGANTTFSTTTSSNIVFRINADTGNRDMTIADYNGISGESPVGVVDFDADHILVAVEKTGARRIEKVERRLNGARSNFSTDTAAFSAALLDMKKSKDGGVFVSRTNGVALISAAGTTQVASFVTGNAGGTCGATNAKYASLSVTDLGHLVALNSENGDNQIGILKGGPTCLAGTSPTPGNAYLTASAFVRGHGQLIVAAAGNTAAATMNTLSVYDVTETPTSATLGSPTVLYDTSGFPATYPYQLYAISAIAYDPVTGHLYVASANQIAANIATAGNYIIEKFAYDPATKTLTRIGTVPFYTSGVDTKCISSLFVGN